MKAKALITLLAVAIILAPGCKKDEDEPKLVGTFTLGGEKFEIFSEDEQPTGTFQVFHEQSSGISGGAFTFSGVNDKHSATIQIAIEYPTSEGISGDYENGDVSSADHVYEPWLSSYTLTNTGGTGTTNVNEPDGSLTVSRNGEDNFTISFDFIFSDSTTAKGTITQDYLVQEMSI